jgi:hypothetical protein
VALSQPSGEVHDEPLGSFLGRQRDLIRFTNRRRTVTRVCVSCQSFHRLDEFRTGSPVSIGHVRIVGHASSCMYFAGRERVST